MSESPFPPSLLREGRAMLAALVADFLAIPGCHVATTLDERLRESSPLPNSPFLGVEYIDEVLTERTIFDRLCMAADSTFVIAPETGGELRRRVQRVVDLGGRVLNCSSPAIDLCADKLRLAEHLLDRDVATIQTRLVRIDDNPWDDFLGDCVVKPRDGAGSWLTFRVRNRDTTSWQNACNSLKASGVLDRATIQPYIEGQPLSVGCLCDASGNVEILPIARQHLMGDTFQYRGGSLPIELDRQAVAAIRELVRAACRSIEGLLGYVGVDLLLPDADPNRPLIVEFNPRLTTSYVGYRKFCEDNIAERMLALGSAREPLSPLIWKPGLVTFGANGECQYSNID
eukprot:TRINITY_DN277_c0_g1_i4.p1 TRINITY_DN277_c0_g1~~TRINITY_DN277_c0_g1_i4.p1  ORF type:complete len:343 (-),score=59.72 TRINITY_DN277_c0_g1_i4:2473-3501(-)